jgi:hypothetical protein
MSVVEDRLNGYGGFKLDRFDFAKRACFFGSASKIERWGGLSRSVESSRDNQYRLFENCDPYVLLRELALKVSFRQKVSVA